MQDNDVSYDKEGIVFPALYAIATWTEPKNEKQQIMRYYFKPKEAEDS